MCNNDLNGHLYFKGLRTYPERDLEEEQLHDPAKEQRSSRGEEDEASNCSRDSGFIDHVVVEVETNDQRSRREQASCQRESQHSFLFW